MRYKIMFFIFLKKNVNLLPSKSWLDKWILTKKYKIDFQNGKQLWFPIGMISITLQPVYNMVRYNMVCYNTILDVTRFWI